MKIVVLMENTKCDPDLTCEHGLSLYIEANKKKILFDAGQTGAFAENAEKLGIDLSQVDACVLSHGHYDHGGGLKRFLEINQKAKIYVSAYAFGQHFHNRERYNGLDQSLPRQRFVFVSEKTELFPGILIDPCGERTENAGSQGMYVVENGIWEPERFRHEQYLLITQGQKRYLFSGCAHRGVVNIENWFRPDVFVGGFHLLEAGQEEVLSVAKQLAAFDTVYYTGHCTGEKSFSLLKTILADRLCALSTGVEITL